MARGSSPRRSAPLALPLVIAALAGPAAAAPASDAPRLSLEDRVLAQEAIERVYYSHQEGAAANFDEAVPVDLLERKVRTYLRQSAALATLWSRPVTAGMLRAELERIERETRFPERLEEIYAALDHDTVLLQETFVRAVLVDRLARRYFDWDDRIHDQAGREGDEILTMGGRGAGRITWDEWWRFSSHRFDENSVRPVAERLAGPAGDLAPVSSQEASACLPDDVWTPYLSEAPSYLGDFTTVWTGTRMLIWGGEVAVPILYDPLTDSWTRGSGTGAPILRAQASGVWTGSEMIVWGGSPSGYSNVFGTGGRYDPVADTWTAVSVTGAPAPRRRHTAVWTGSEMIIWGGFDPVTGPYGDGARYDPASDSWMPVSGTAAPQARWLHTARWTGAEMILWGGRDANGGQLGDGGRYDTVLDAWAPVSLTGAPAERQEHVAVWTGAEMIVWGGWEITTGTYFDTGGAYTPGSDTWRVISTVGAPSARTHAGHAWTGGEMVIWGGRNGSTALHTGARYDPAQDDWAPISSVNAPAVSSSFQALWTGAELVALDLRVTGGRYDPASDAWTPVSSGGAPEFRIAHSTVWTGNEMIVWGGSWNPFAQGQHHDTGGRYDPLTSTWKPTSTIAAPDPRVYHSAVWTGNEMIVWGGSLTIDGFGTEKNTGSRYDPIADTWTPTATLKAPSGRFMHAALWTGSEMLVWGGSVSYGEEDLCTGARYDPASDSWTAISTTNAPDARNFFEGTAVWTGTEMIVWGGIVWGLGCPGNPPYGARYDPSTDTWTPLPPAGSRWEHSAVWTGAEMIVWGGDDGGSLDTGKKYDPSTNTWTPLTTLNAPASRYGHSAVWTDKEMIVWGGDVAGGGRYDPARDRWTPMTGLSEPSRRRYEEMVWTGSEALTWAGYGAVSGVAAGVDGGRYSLGGGTDDDGDGFSECDGDCYDLDPNVYPGAPEICDFEDSDCDGIRPADEVDADGDGVLLCFPDCDDDDPLRYPGSAEHCDRIDNDCDLALPPEEIDSDSDGLTPCESDCDDTDPSLLAPPVAVGGLEAVMLPGGARLTWNGQAATAGTATTYDVFSGAAGGLRPSGGDFSAGACAAADLAVTAHDDGTPDPPPGGVAYFMIRAQNGCGGGTWGGANRDTTAALSAAPCP